jgi:membrane protease YdiL (CAAX protease family)
MDRLYIQRYFAAVFIPTETCPLLDDSSRKLNLPLILETILVIIVTIGAMKVLGNGSRLVPAWLMIPGILIFAAFLPTAIRREGFRQLGFNINHLTYSLAVLGWTCITVFSLTFCVLWILESFGFNILFQPVLPKGKDWISWFFYQFMYIALAEEVFFRGYIQSNVLRLTVPILSKWPLRGQWISIGISAAFFAVAHIVIQGHIISALTFFPGLVLGWLFIRTKSLLAPILFHGLANAFYLVISVFFA